MLFAADRNTLLDLKKRTRSMPAMLKALGTANTPPVYIFNIGPRTFAQETPRGTIRIPACKAGEKYSEPVLVPGLVLSEYDLGDSGGAMGTTVDPGLDAIGDDGSQLYGVAEDIIGKHSTSAGLDLQTTNLEWFGVFATSNQVPTDAELAAANGKLRQMMALVYDDAANKVRQNDPGHRNPSCMMQERALGNDAARFLGRPLLFGTEDHTMDRCVFCREPIVSGAIKCRHCNSRLDSKEAKDLLNPQPVA